MIYGLPADGNRGEGGGLRGEGKVRLAEGITPDDDGGGDGGGWWRWWRWWL